MRIRVGPTTWAWEPVTPRGVAAFAAAPVGRVLLAGLVVAVLSAATVVWFLHGAWFPTVRKALHALPTQGEVRQGKLLWRGESPVLLAGDRFLSLVVDLNHEGEVGHESDICVEFGQTGLRLISLLGYAELGYPPDRILDANRPGLEPWWGAREAAVLAVACGSVIVVFGVVWLALASAYCLPVWLIAFFANRGLSFPQAWRLAAAALLPGALLMVLAIFVYGAGFLDAIRLGLCAALHLVVGWIYLFVSPWFLPADPTARTTKENPFSS